MWLIMPAPDGSSQPLEIRDDMLIGRAEECDLVISDDRISRRHAFLSVNRDGSLMLQDLESSNGTWLNGRRITAAALLREGDSVRFGDTITSVSTSRDGSVVQSGELGAAQQLGGTALDMAAIATPVESAGNRPAPPAPAPPPAPETHPVPSIGGVSVGAVEDRTQVDISVPTGSSNRRRSLVFAAAGVVAVIALGTGAVFAIKTSGSPSPSDSQASRSVGPSPKVSESSESSGAGSGDLAVNDCVNDGPSPEEVPCSSPAADARVIALTVTEFACPAATEFTLTIFGGAPAANVACMVKLDSPGPSPGAGGGGVVVGDCFDNALVSPEEVPCRSPRAATRVVGIKTTQQACPRKADAFLTFVSGPLAGRVACLVDIRSHTKLSGQRAHMKTTTARGPR
jgi:hypothetical protein